MPARRRTIRWILATRSMVSLLWGQFITFGQTAVAAQPGEGAFDNPPCREEREPLAPLRPFDQRQADFPPRPQAPEPGDKASRRGLIGPDQPHPGATVAGVCQHGHGPSALLDAGGGDHHGRQSAYGRAEDMARAAIDVFGGIIPVEPPLAVVLTDRRARMPAPGGRGLPAAPPPWPRRRSCITCQVPSCGHGRKSWSALRHGGRSWGSMRQEQPLRG